MTNSGPGQLSEEMNRIIGVGCSAVAAIHYEITRTNVLNAECQVFRVVPDEL
jgi:hypothetical protein